MPFLKTLLDYLTYLNLVVAFSAYALAAGVVSILGIDRYFDYGLFAFFATYSVYNTQRLFNHRATPNNPRLTWMFTNMKLVLVSCAISLILTLYYFIRLINGIDISVIVLMCIATLISLLYVMRIGKKNLRDISYVKTHSIALTWTLVILVFPIVNENISLSKPLLFFILAHYLYILAIAATFDIKDIKTDPSTQRTIPQIVGFRRTKTTSIILLTLSMIGISYFRFDPIILAALITQIILIGAVTDKHKDAYFDILIDGAISLLGIAYLIV